MERRVGRTWTRLAVTATIATAAIVAVATLLLHLLRLPDDAGRKFRSSTCYYDSLGRLVHVDPGTDYQWNFPVKLEQIPDDMIRFVIAVEDRNFPLHKGVDWGAGLRAGYQLLTNGRVISGASTITMQLVTMHSGRSRSISYKIKQICYALNWEKSHGKAEILEEYLNRLPYGGKLCGIEAAARYYFGRHVWELNRSEMVLLCGLPQAPNRYRPDRHPQRAMLRRNLVLHQLVRAGALTEEEARSIELEPLRFRDFAQPAWPRLADTQYLRVAERGQPDLLEYRLPWDMQLQGVCLAALRHECEILAGVKDGAAVVIDNRSGSMLAMVGTLNPKDPVDGAVNAAIAWRSPGSALKPFIYGEAIYGGLVVADTRILDAPLDLRDYRPGNFDGSYRGIVLCNVALADSLNTPAVRLLKEVGLPRMIEFCTTQEIFGGVKIPKAENVGLAFAIGGAETTLLRLTRAYSRLSSVWRGDAPWNGGTREMLLEMLRTNPLPGGGGLEVAWKTGTSNGNRDAWCFGVTPDYTVGVWLGNKSGAASPALVGADAAAPVVAAVLQYLHRGNPPVWPVGSGTLIRVRLCEATGLRAGLNCSGVAERPVVADVPLRVCAKCTAENRGFQKSRTRILSPLPGEYLAKGETTGFKLEMEPSPANIYLDGKFLGKFHAGYMLRLSSGPHRIMVWPGEDWEAATVDLLISP